MPASLEHARYRFIRRRRRQDTTARIRGSQEDQIALDGDCDDSPFAIAMLQRIATAGAEISQSATT